MKIDKRHHKAIQMLYESSFTRKEIADELKVSEQTLYNWLRDDDFLKAYDEYVRLIMRSSTGSALRTMLSLLNARSEMVKFNAAKDILDRGGIIESKENGTGVTINITNDVVEFDSDG